MCLVGAGCPEQWGIGLLSHIPLQTGVEQYIWHIVKHFEMQGWSFAL